MKATRKQDQELRVAAYLRVSTEEQKDSKLGLEAQEKQIRGMATAKNWPMPSIYRDEAVSGKIDIRKRQDGARLLADIASGKINAVIVSALDRIGRRVVHVLNFIEQTKDIQLVSCKESLDTTTAFGQAMLTMALVFAEMEAGLISERTTAALDARGDRDGIKAGLPPYGYFHKYADSDVTVNEQEAVIVRYVYLLRGQKLSLRAIAEKVEQDKGVRIGFNTVKNILGREAVYSGGKRGESEHTWPIILN